jgi:hypothetical protein
MHMRFMHTVPLPWYHQQLVSSSVLVCAWYSWRLQESLNEDAFDGSVSQRQLLLLGAGSADELLEAVVVAFCCCSVGLLHIDHVCWLLQCSAYLDINC